MDGAIEKMDFLADVLKTLYKTDVNSTLPKVAVQCFVGQFCGYITLVLRMNVCAENRHLRQAANRYEK